MNTQTMLGNCCAYWSVDSEERKIVKQELPSNVMFEFVSDILKINITDMVLLFPTVLPRQFHY